MVVERELLRGGAQAVAGGTLARKEAGEAGSYSLGVRRGRDQRVA
jgi:hypothetical protein